MEQKFENQSFQELITNSIYCIKTIKDVDKNLQEIIDELEEKEANNEDIFQIKTNLENGKTNLKELNQILLALKSKQLESEKLNQVKKLQETYDKLNQGLENQNLKIKDLSFVLQRISDMSLQRESQMSLLMQGEVSEQEILDQKELVDERQQNIDEINKIIVEIKDVGLIIQETVKEDGIKIDQMIHKQEIHKNNLENNIKQDLQETEMYQGKMIKSCLWLVMLLIIILMITIFIFLQNKPGTQNNNLQQKIPNKILLQII